MKIEVTSEGHAIRLRTDLENVLLSNQTIEIVSLILEKNFYTVRNSLLANAINALSETQLDELSLKIIFRYLAMYNTWRLAYPKERDRDLTFILSDLDTPMTYDLVTDYIKTNYRKDFQEKCAQILGISLEKYLIHEQARKEFMDRR